MNENFFQDLHQKGIHKIEISLSKLLKLYNEGKISTMQWIKLLKQYHGEDKFNELFQNALENWFKDFKLEDV